MSSTKRKDNVPTEQPNLGQEEAEEERLGKDRRRTWEIARSARVRNRHGIHISRRSGNRAC
jgi:hypothetical protein